MKEEEGASLQEEEEAATVGPSDCSPIFLNDETNVVVAVYKVPISYYLYNNNVFFVEYLPF